MPFRLVRAALLVAMSLGAFGTPAALGDVQPIRIGHFPNVTHVQALVARNFERQGRGWYGSRMPEGVRLQWFAYNAGPSAMEAIFAGRLDLAYVGPIPRSMHMPAPAATRSASSPAP